MTYYIQEFNIHTFSNFFCQYSSLLVIISIQLERLARIPAVVALNVMASPLKSMLLTSNGLPPMLKWGRAKPRPGNAADLNANGSLPVRL